ncbi:MAG TPA: hypothetical protein VIK27_13160 [Candidatus Aquilonibacter sp.]
MYETTAIISLLVYAEAGVHPGQTSAARHRSARHMTRTARHIGRDIVRDGFLRVHDDRASQSDRIAERPRRERFGVVERLRRLRRRLRASGQQGDDRQKQQTKT